jgi:hypothetical protein
MTIRVRGVMGVALASVIAGACVSGTGGAGDREVRREAGIIVEVTNQNWQDITVYAVSSGTRRRLGTVVSTSTETFALPRTMVTGGTIQLVAAPVRSGRNYRTGIIMVNAGDRIVWSVENSLSLSTYVVNPLPGQR